MLTRIKVKYIRCLQYILFGGGFIFVTSCGSSKPYYADDSGNRFLEDSAIQKEIAYSIFLIGDAGKPNLTGKDETLATLQAHLNEAGANSSVIFLGDNIYENGMPPDTADPEREIAEKRIVGSLQALEGFQGRSFFIPGNHDWRYGKEGVRAQEAFIEQYANAEAEHIPSDGCPGPSAVALTGDWLLLALDSEWWINQSVKQKHASVTAGCESRSREEAINTVEKIVERNAGKKILVSFHHPLYSNGTHGGYFPLKDHIFPLTNIQKRLYLPLPVVGSIYPIYRKLGNSGQDIRNNRYQKFKEEILKATENAPNVFFASGHEHSLTLFDKEDHVAIVSGSGSKVSYARRGLGADFVYSQHGFAKLISYKDGSVSIEFLVPRIGQQKGELVFRKELIQPNPHQADNATSGSKESSEEKKVTVAAGPGYQAGTLKRAIWGDHYRDAWTTPIQVPVIDLDTKKGGLKVLKKSGGQQSVSIIVQDSSGQKYIMRSVQKDPSKALPEVLRETFANDIVQDQISASHPYGAFIIPPLADAAGVYHTTPELGYISEESDLEFTDDSGGAMVLFEEFVNKEWFNRVYDADAVDVVDTDELWERLRQSNRNRVNERQLARSRLFDMFIGDWDRHEGQWFWAEQATPEGSVFEPIPIDRDNAFFTSDGFVPRLASRKWALRKFQHFDEDIRDIAGINFNAKDFDRWFLTELTLDEWLDIAREIEQSITDNIIEESIKQWPGPIFELNGETMIRKLKARKEKIPEFARRYYTLLSEVVNIFGSEDAELLEVSRNPDGTTLVSVYTLSEDRNKGERIYERLFLPQETKEIRLYGFGGDDRFEVAGQGEKGIIVRIIGGVGYDRIEDNSLVVARGKLTKVYDTRSGSAVISGSETQKLISEDPAVNRFVKESFQYNYLGPLVTGGYNSDDGLFLGGGVLMRTHSFRKKPFASMHEIKGKHSTLTSAFSFDYAGVFTEAVGSYDVAVDLNIRAPNYNANYFGLGNETRRVNDSRTFYRFRIDQALFSGSLQKRISHITALHFGAGYDYYEPSSTEGRFVASSASGLDESDFKARNYASLGTAFDINTTDNEILPQYGIRFNAEGALKIGLDGRSETFGRLSTEASLYYTFESFPATLAFRAGASTNIGDFEFFQANTLGGQTLLGEPGNLRGLLRDRFAGRTSFYHNTEFRARLFDFQSYLFPAGVGILGFFDNGRVWISGETSDNWHQGYGGGIWISPFRRSVLTATYGISKEDRLFSVNLGFMF